MGDVEHPRMAIGPSGQVVCTYQRQSPTPSIAYVSSDSGLRGTFLNPTFSGTDFGSTAGVVANLLTYMWNKGGAQDPDPNTTGTFTPAPIRGVYNEPEIAWDFARNKIYVTYTDFRTSATWPDTDVYVAYAAYNSQGMSWTVANSGAPVNPLNDGATHFMGAIAVDQDSGKVAVGWYDGRCDTANHQALEYYAALSTNGGISFGANWPLTPGPNWPLTPGESNANVLNWGNGAAKDDLLDYTAMAYAGGVLYAVWADNANFPAQNSSGTTDFLDIYMAFGVPPSP
jgi:hypothetical protein